MRFALLLVLGAGIIGQSAVASNKTNLHSVMPAGVDPRLSKFGLFATHTIKLNDRTKLKPWWIATTNLELGYGNRLVANVVASGDVNLRRPVMWGNLMYGGALTSQGSVPLSIQGSVDKAPLSEFAPIELRVTMPSSPGSGSLSVEPGKTLELPPGSYGAISVKSRATLVLNGGEYIVDGFHLEPGSNVVVNFQNMPIEIWVASSLGFKSGTTFTLNGGDAGDIMWLYAGSAPVAYDGQISYTPVVKAGSGVPGTLVAPYADVSLASNARIWGAIWAKKIEIHQDNAFCEFVPYDANPRSTDRDGDGLENLDELRIGSDLLDYDTDDDGFADGLEYWGRGEGNVLGAVNSIGTQAPSWGYFLDPKRTEFFSPLRKDVFFRYFWQPDDELEEGSIASWMANPEILGQYRKAFANPENYQKVADSSIAWVGTNSVSLHIDAGEVIENLPSDFLAKGGPKLTESASREGYYAFGLNGSTIASLENLELMTDAIFKGLSNDAFPDIFVHAYGLESAEHAGYGDVWLGYLHVTHSKYATPSRLAIGLLHEMGHTLSLGHPEGQDEYKTINYIHQGVMNYSFHEGRMVCTMAKAGQPSGSWGDTRWCGDAPEPIGIVPLESHPRYGQPYYQNFSDETLRIHVPWWKDADPLVTVNPAYDNEPLTVKSRPYHYRHGNMDRSTGFHRGATSHSPLLEDLTFSTARLCPMQFSKIDEKLGAAICRDRNGKSLPVPDVLSPIDWNMDGVINGNFVVLDDGNTELWKNYFFWKPSLAQMEPPKNEWMVLGDINPRSYDGALWRRTAFKMGLVATHKIHPVRIRPDGYSLTHAFEIP